MPLDEYRKKRDFNKTPEPSGDEPARTSAGTRYFCVQKHLASHLHYDLRLEHNGVLLSWAVPKGPSINPGDRRLAMQTEDHPFDYGSFEGVIPEGYGAGVVMLWDRGTWTPESPDIDAALKNGDLKFRLDGYKLKGSWVLVRTRGYGDSGKTSWLLIKHKDEWAGPIDITEFAPLSVKTPDADFADILAQDTPAIWHSNPPAKGGDTGKLFQRIIATALELRDNRHTGAPARPMSAAKAAERLSDLEPTAKAPARARKTPAPRAARKAPAATSRARKKTTGGSR
jgi:DNA ligase D-like protein (predicted 3'-phosphoesterase)